MHRNDHLCASAKEKAALAWTEALTLISENHMQNEIYHEANKYSSERELVDLTHAIIAINAWDRLSTSIRDTA